MKFEKELRERSGSKCELCSSTNELSSFIVTPKRGDAIDECVFICKTCSNQINNPDTIDPNHWRCLNDSMWSEIPAVQVIAWRMLNNLKDQGWPQDLLDMLYLEENTQIWANEDSIGENEDSIIHKDSNGARLNSGDTVTLVKDLNVKGGGFTAKRGTAVRNINLVHDNEEQIEGKVNGQHIVILTQYVKKS